MIHLRRTGSRRLFAIHADEADAVSFPVEIKTFKTKHGKTRGPKLIRPLRASRTGDDPNGVARQIVIRSALTVPSIDKA